MARIAKVITKGKRNAGAMLDDLKYIHQRDGSDALGAAERQWRQLKHDYQVKWRPDREIRDVLLAGMGGSALAGGLISSWPETTVPFVVARDYDLPRHAGPATLFIASSYSGNTEETLAATAAAEKRGCLIVVIAAGGALVARAAEKGYPLFKPPGGLPPRMAVFYDLAALVQILAAAGLIGKSKLAELRAAAGWLGRSISGWTPTVPTEDNLAKQLALEAIGRSLVIYSGPKLFPAAYKWKINFNENAKNIAWCNQYPEFNHNEILGWVSQPTDKPYTVFELRSRLEHERVRQRFEITDRLLSGRRPAPEVVNAEGDSLLEHLLWTIALGDFVSLYLALLNGLDPTPVELIEKLKIALR